MRRVGKIEGGDPAVLWIVKGGGSTSLIFMGKGKEKVPSTGTRNETRIISKKHTLVLEKREKGSLGKKLHKGGGLNSSSPNDQRKGETRYKHPDVSQKSIP